MSELNVKGEETIKKISDEDLEKVSGGGYVQLHDCPKCGKETLWDFNVPDLEDPTKMVNRCRTCKYSVPA